MFNIIIYSIATIWFRVHHARTWFGGEWLRVIKNPALLLYALCRGEYR